MSFYITTSFLTITFELLKILTKYVPDGRFLTLMLTDSSLISASCRTCPAADTTSMRVMFWVALISTMSVAGFGKMSMLVSTLLMFVTIAVALSEASEVPPFAQLVMI